MFEMKTDELGNHVMETCGKCGVEVRIPCKDHEEVQNWNDDLEVGCGSGVYIYYHTYCAKCEKQKNEETYATERYYELRDDAGYQSLVFDEDKENFGDM